MKRIVKFRAWCEIEKEWIKDFAIKFDGGILELDQNELNYDSLELAYPDRYKSIIIVQFTGLKDKNGKEIYEGDVVKQEGEANSEIIFSIGSFCGKEINGWDRMTRIYPLAGNIEKTEIIGNIFENPELIKDLNK